MPGHPSNAALAAKTHGSATLYTRRKAQVTLQKREGSPMSSDRVQPPMLPKPTPGTKLRSLHPFSQPPVSEAQQLTALASEEAYNIIRDFPYEGEEKEYLLNLLRTRRDAPWGASDHCLVVYGKTGQGKSHTIISLTGLDLGNAMGGTGSVTNTVMEFRACYNDQKHPYLVQIFLYSKQYVMRMFQDDLHEYRQWRSAHPETNREDDSGDEDNEAAEAPTRLTTMMIDLKFLRQEQGFHDYDDAEMYLEKHSDKEILIHLREWLDKLYHDIQGGDAITSKIEKGCTTVDSVKKFIAPFVRKASEPFAEGTDAECCPYPLVEKVVVASGSQVLSKGNILKDAPGVGDTNKAHVDRAHTALKDADKIMVVSEMRRCLANNELCATIKTALKRRGPGGVLLALTHSAEIDEKIKIEARGRFTKEERQSYATIKQQISQLDVELRLLKEQEENVDDMASKREVEEQIWEKKIKRNELENADFEIHVLARNQQTIVDFRGTLLSKKIWKKQYPKLTIVCIDNYEYSKHAQGYAPWSPDERDEAPRLSQEATGVPALSRIIADFPADGRWETLKHHIHETWECTMNSLEMSGTVTIAQRKAEVDEQFAQSCQNIVSNIADQFEDLLNGHLEGAKDHMAQKEKSWVEGGIDIHAGFVKLMKPPTHRALMQKRGQTTTRKGEEFDLNDKLYEEPRKVIVANLDDLTDDRIPRFFTDLIQGIRSTVEGLFNEFEHGPHYDAVGLSAKVQAGIRVRQRKLEGTCTTAQKNAITMIRDMRDRALEAHGTFTYFSAAINPAYDAANGAQKAKKSKSIHDARCKAFEKVLTMPDGPYHQLHIMIFEELTGELDQIREKLIRDITDVFAEIKHEIDMACSRKDDHSPEAKAFRVEIMRQTKKLRSLFTDRIRPCLVEAENMAKDLREQERANQRMPKS